MATRRAAEDEGDEAVEIVEEVVAEDRGVIEYDDRDDAARRRAPPERFSGPDPGPAAAPPSAPDPPVNGRCAAARSPPFGSILDRFWIDPRKAQNSAPPSPLRPPHAHITNVGLVGEIPTVEPDNWTTPMNKPYNSYRRNAQGSADFCAPDLVLYDLDADFDICPKIGACVWVANQG
ncbi:MAG: hypothetical protein H6716_28085, partial [Polyangiaceae bacterium]|nr:hypothetical protein [Polyangiaceae bacterium]